MKIVAETVEERLKHFTTVCRNEGIKLTPQRLEIFRQVALAEDHPDAEQVLRRVRHRMPTVSLDTVYRTLWLLHDLRLIKTLGSGRESTRFDANLERHHHFVCGECGYTRDFVSDDLNNIKLPEALSVFGMVEATHVEVRGICKSCLEKKTTINNHGR